MKLHRKIIRRTEVLKRTGMAVSTIYAEIQKGLFPKPVKLGPRSVGWVEDEVDQHVQSLIASRDSKKPSAGFNASRKLHQIASRRTTPKSKKKG